MSDSFGRQHRYLRISLTERCNLRCTYCMPADGVALRPKPELLTFEEIVRLAQLFSRLGVSKIRLTGGEPLVRKDIELLTARLAAIPGIDSLAITTNGLLLPRKLEALQRAGVTLFNISLDTFRAHRFKEMTRRDGLDVVLESIEQTIAAGYDPVKINCVVLRGINEDEILEFVEFTKSRPVEVRFIEYMPFDGNAWHDGQFFPYEEMVHVVQAAHPDLERRTDAAHHTAKLWAVPGYRGSLGFISSMSENFCGGCNRLRLTADGSLKVCLFGRGEVSLRDAIREGRSDHELETLIEAAVKRKKATHDGMYEIAKTPNRPMILIGG